MFIHSYGCMLGIVCMSGLCVFNCINNTSAPTNTSMFARDVSSVAYYLLLYRVLIPQEMGP